jgi:hypothetical protein
MINRITSHGLRGLLIFVSALIVIGAGMRTAHAQQDIRGELCEYRYAIALQRCEGQGNNPDCISQAQAEYTLCILGAGSGGGGGGGGLNDCGQARWEADLCWDNYEGCGGLEVDGCWDTYYQCWIDSGIDQCQ